MLNVEVNKSEGFRENPEDEKNPSDFFAVPKVYQDLRCGETR
jgi:hypothetical protein